MDDPAGPWAEAQRQAEQQGAHASYLARVDELWPPVQDTVRRLREYQARIDRARAAGTDDVGVPLAERRRRALAPRPGDYTGGPVDYATGKPIIKGVA